MEGRPERIVDYFVVVGLGENVSPFRVETFGEVGESLHLTTPTNVEPITEVAVIAKKYEACPKGFRCIDTTPNGNSGSLTGGGLFGTSLFLCYRQGGDRPPITEISIYSAEHSKHFPAGHETIAVTTSGRSADLSGGGRYPIYLTVKRGLAHGYNTSSAITGLSVIVGNKEDPPSGYKPLPTPLGRGYLSSGVKICYKSSLLCPPSVAYTAEILSRYPMADYPEFPLPESVPLFCLPFGVSVEAWERHASFPLPTFSTFALTSAVGQCMYGACVVFYERVPDTVSAIQDMKRALGLGIEGILHMSKCVCLLSHWPFFSAFKAFLSALYRLSISKNVFLPLERYVANLMFHVPFPSVERPRVQMLIGPETIVFSLPVQTPLPMGVSTHWTLLTCLDVENCLTLMHLVLLEQKIVLHSTRPALLTSVGEALRSVLFPLQWQCTYIPMCPLAFSSYLQAPVPFIIGMDSRYFDNYTAPPGVCVIDLDVNTITIGNDMKTFISMNPLPLKAVRLLRKNLTALASEVSSLSFGGDFAVEVAPLDFGDQYKAEQERVDVTIREVFLKFIALLLANYRSYLCPLMAPPSCCVQDISELFNLDLFIKQKPTIERSFYKTFCDTQTFTSFIEQRSFSHAESNALGFFDECTEKIIADSNAKLLNIDAIVHRRHDLPTVVTPPPDESGLPQGKRYSYPFFPALDPTLFHSPLTSSTKSPYQKTPTPTRLTTQSSLVNMAVRTQAEKAKSKALIQRASGSDALWATVLLSHACSLWYMLLSYHLRSQWNKVEVLSQAMDLLDALRTRQALPNDEVCYRALMEQCVEIGRPALAVKVYSEMQKAGIHPSAVTYGFYNKAIMEGKWPSTKRRWNVLRIVVYACFYLREMSQKSEKEGQKGSIISLDEAQANFRLLRRSSSSEVSVNALDVGVETIQDPPQRRDSMGRITRGSVYRLSSGHTQSDYAVRGDSFYIADKLPLLQSRDSPIRSGWGLQSFLGHTPTRQTEKAYRRSTARDADGALLEVWLCSCSQCPECHSLLYDEEIMVSWSEGSAEEYNISCPYCNNSLVPSLTVTTRKILPFTPSDTGSAKSLTSSPEKIIEEGPKEPVCQDQDFEHSTSASNSPKKPHSEPMHRKSLSMGGLIEPSIDDFDDEQLLYPSTPNSTSVEQHADTCSPLSGTSSPSIEEQDGGISQYIALLRARGHKRVSSAPTALSPLNTSSLKQSATVSNGSSSSINVKTNEQKDDDSDHVKMRPRRSSFRIEDGDPLTVPYLSPIVLRKELESLLTQGKGSILSSESVALDKPILYWNLVWYFSRLKLPTYLPLLTLRRFIKEHPELKQSGVRMLVKTLWDRRLPGISDPLYMIWMGKAPGVIQMPMDRRRRVRKDSNSQLQPLVARMHCGDLQYIMRSLLTDRLDAQKGEEREEKVGCIKRSIYRQMLFLKCVLFPDSIDIDLFDKEYQLCLQRLPKELAILLQSWDYPPTLKAINCRKEFGHLQII